MIESLDEVEGTAGKFQTRWNEKIEIRSIRDEGLELSYAVKWNPYFKEWSFWTPMALMADERSDIDAIDAQLGIAIEGIRVETGCPGFSRGRIAAIANVSGRRAPRTNVARTALEKTAELDSLVLRLYRGYCSHLASEIIELVDRRGSSVTKAASELQYLVTPISTPGTRGGSASSRLLFKALREVPAYIIEHQGARKMLSAVDLESAGDFVSFDSTMIRRMESLLSELPGSITLSDIARLGGGDQDPDWETSHPRLCGVNRGVFGKLLRNEWEPKEIKVNDSGQLTTYWARINQEEGDQRRWSLVPGRASVNISEIAQYIDMYAQRLSDYGNRGTESVYIPCGDISVGGLDGFDAAIVDRNLYILPNSAIVALELNNSLSESERHIIISSIAKLLASQQIQRNRPKRFSGTPYDDLLDSLMRLEVDSVMPVTNFREMLSLDFRIFDISQWDREFAGSSPYI